MTRSIRPFHSRTRRAPDLSPMPSRVVGPRVAKGRACPDSRASPLISRRRRKIAGSSALAIDRSERGSIYRIEKGPAAEKSAAAHSDVAQADPETPSKKVHRHVKSKVRRAA